MRILTALSATVLLAACGAPNDGEVSEAGEEIGENAPVFGARSDQPVAGVDPDETRQWFYRAATRTAVFGDSEDDGIITLSCNSAMDGDAAVIFQWTEGASDNAKQTVTATVGDREITFPVTGEASAIGPDAIWSGSLAVEAPELGFLADSETAIRFDLGELSVVTPPGDAIETVVEACRAV